ncbi:MAG TPA: c(7)-type cytochrome triheme domain-containing protein [Thermodesulfovibrionales bacterium]|nr:c(7)-type cytochrome triheme domain-containing protein [Thermodesulfovibrionales bacterium]
MRKSMVASSALLSLLVLLGGCSTSSKVVKEKNEGKAQAEGGIVDLPPMLSPEEYGDILMKRSSTINNMTPVVFSHWVHRAKFTCGVCHYELDFAMATNTTPLVCENGTMQGRYCAACHNGKEEGTFGPKGEEGDNCKRCHNANAGPDREKFLALQKKLPGSKFGNQIDWVKALNKRLIDPKRSLSGNIKTIVLSKTLILRAEMSGISPAIFPHKTHEQWMDCSDCHPELFNIKKKTTATLRMKNMINGESCAVCHLRVAFPLNDCQRCHPSMRG